MRLQLSKRIFLVIQILKYSTGFFPLFFCLTLYIIAANNKSMTKLYYESLPDACPESDARPANNEKFYRLVKTVPATDLDFQSKKMRQPNKLFEGISDCILSSLSIHKKEEISLNKLPTLKGTKPAIINLGPNDGLIKQTFTNPHYSWWRARDFNIINSVSY